MTRLIVSLVTVICLSLSSGLGVAWATLWPAPHAAAELHPQVPGAHGHATVAAPASGAVKDAAPARLTGMAHRQMTMAQSGRSGDCADMPDCPAKAGLACIWACALGVAAPLTAPAELRPGAVSLRQARLIAAQPALRGRHPLPSERPPKRIGP